MSRLIDADLLIKDFEEEVMKCDFDKLSDNDKLIIETSARALVSFAKRQPIAYNVDAVVEEIEKIRMVCYLTMGNTGNECYDTAYIEICKVVEQIEKIVKRGGKNE